MKRILLFITATLLLASGTSCSDDNTNFDPIGDELGIPYKDGHDVYGVEVWEETSVILTNYYSLIEEIIQEKTAKIQSIWWLSPAKEKCNVRWNCSAPIMGKTDHSSSYIINPDYNMNSSQITIDLTDVTDNFTVEAIVSIGNLSIRRFQTIPIVTNEIRCDAFYYTFGTPLMQLENNIDNENTLNSDILKATYYARTRPVNFLGFTNLPGQRLEKLYCTATIADPNPLHDLQYACKICLSPEEPEFELQRLEKLYCTATIADPNPLHDLQYACKICLSPEEPEFELQSGSENVYRVLNPQQWEINGLLCTLENTTWQQLGASENTDDTEFACLTIKKL